MVFGHEYRRKSNYAQQGTQYGRKKYYKRRADGNIRKRVAYQKPSEHNQQKQLATLARLATKSAKILQNATTYTDWFRNELANVATVNSFFAAELTSMDDLNAGNRQSLDVLTSQTTYCRNMIFEWNADTQNKKQLVDWDLFIVSSRPSSAAFAPGAAPVISQPNEFIEMGRPNAPILNSGMFKVHWSKSFRTFPLLAEGQIATEFSFTPTNTEFTYKRGRVNIQVNYKLRAPANNSWKELKQEDLPPERRLWLLYRVKSTDITETSLLQWGTFFTMVSQD